MNANAARQPWVCWVLCAAFVVASAVAALGCARRTVVDRAVGIVAAEDAEPDDAESDALEVFICADTAQTVTLAGPVHYEGLLLGVSRRSRLYSLRRAGRSPPLRS